jgi:hypothetical protein
MDPEGLRIASLGARSETFLARTLCATLFRPYNQNRTPGSEESPFPAINPAAPRGGPRDRTHKICRHPGHNPALPSQHPYGPDPT